MSTLTLALARTDAELRALAPDWEALWRRVPDTTPFQSPAWLLPWWEQFGTREPRAAALRAEGGRLLGLLPLYILTEGAERKLLPIGAGTTDYLDLLLDPEAPPAAAARLLLAALEGAAEAGVTACDLANLPPGSALREAVPPAGWREAARWAESCTVLALPAGTARLRDVVPMRKLRDLRLARNRARAAGGWTTEMAEASSLGCLLAELIRLHQDRWTADAEPGVFADARVGALHRAAAPELLRRGLLRLWVLRLGGQVAAAYYVLLAGAGRMLFYLCCRDRASARHSPGTLLMGEIIEQALNEGWRELHFLRGSEAFKYRWGAVERPLLSRRLVPG